MSSAACRLLAACLVLVFAAAARAQFVPWGALVAGPGPDYESWIYYGAGDTTLTLHTVNAGDYQVTFDQAKNNGGARGLNALKFSWGGANTGHLVSDSLAGSFAVENTGDNRTFADLVLLVAIDAMSLPPGFAFSLGVQGETPYAFDPATEFGHYDPAALGYDAGRPSGYYPGWPPEGAFPDGTSPAASPVAYSFASGMVTLWGAPGVDLGPLGDSVTFDYAFTDLPGPAVFSVYGYDSDTDWIYHTNRGRLDLNDTGRPISTFEVAPEPATLGLLAAGLALLRVFHRRDSRERREKI